MDAFKYSFSNDYSELAHPEVLAALAAVGMRQFEGYGEDEYCQRAAILIKELIKQPAAEVHFASGGTQSNLMVLAALLRSHEAVIATTLGHIFTNEAGSVEATGHKVLSVAGEDGKITPAGIESVLAAHTNEHHVKPAVVYISQSTELGSVYNLAELTAVSECCHANGLYLFVDGARLGTALMSPAAGMSYADLARLADVFYIGGTKNGAIYGEAIVIVNDSLKDGFRYQLKQKGALLGKSAGMGIQFEALFRNGLYNQLASQADAMAARLAAGIARLGYGFASPVQSNMLFCHLPAEVVGRLAELYSFHETERAGDMVTIRLVTSWATPAEAVDGFLDDLAQLG